MQTTLSWSLIGLLDPRLCRSGLLECPVHPPYTFHVSVSRPRPLGGTAGLVLVLDRGLKIMSRLWCLFECHAACCHRSSAHVTVAFPEQMAIADVLRYGDGWEVYMRTPGLSEGVHFPEQLAIVNAHRCFPPLMRPGWRSCVLASTRSPVRPLTSVSQPSFFPLLTPHFPFSGWRSCVLASMYRA